VADTSSAIDVIEGSNWVFVTAGVDMATGSLSAGRDSLGRFDPRMLAGFTCQFRIVAGTGGGLARGTTC